MSFQADDRLAYLRIRQCYLWQSRRPALAAPPAGPGPLWGSPGSAERRLSRKGQELALTFGRTACTTPYGNFVNRDEIKRPVYFVLFVLDSFCRTRVWNVALDR